MNAQLARREPTLIPTRLLLYVWVVCNRHCCLLGFGYRRLSGLSNKVRYTRVIAANRRFRWALALTTRLTEHAELRADYAFLQPRYNQLSELAREGVVYAAEIAAVAEVRRRDGLHQPPPRLTMKEVGRRYFTDPQQVSRAIKQARTELFGRNLSDSAIDYRRRHQHTTNNRTCQHPNCRTPLPDSAPPHRRYCDPHATQNARVKRHRNPTTLRSSG
jgi:hypothetical protein